MQRPWTQRHFAPAENAIAKEIRARVTVHDRDGIIRAVAWLQPLLDKWMEKLCGYHKIGETAVMPGAKLADLVAKYMRMVFIEHRKALKNDVNYTTRVRPADSSVGVDALQEVESQIFDKSSRGENFLQLGCLVCTRFQ